MNAKLAAMQIPYTVHYITSRPDLLNPAGSLIYNSAAYWTTGQLSDCHLHCYAFVALIAHQFQVLKYKIINLVLLGIYLELLHTRFMASQNPSRINTVIKDH